MRVILFNIAWTQGVEQNSDITCLWLDLDIPVKFGKRATLNLDALNNNNVYQGPQKVPREVKCLCDHSSLVICRHFFRVEKDIAHTSADWRHALIHCRRGAGVRAYAPDTSFCVFA